MFKQKLDEQSTLVSFWVAEEQTVAFIITRAGFEVVSIDIGVDALNTQIKAFHDFSDDQSAHPATAIALHETLIGPIRDQLKTPHLVIVPHQALNYLPFSAADRW